MRLGLQRLSALAVPLKRRTAPVGQNWAHKHKSKPPTAAIAVVNITLQALIIHGFVVVAEDVVVPKAAALEALALGHGRRLRQCLQESLEGRVVEVQGRLRKSEGDKGYQVSSKHA